MFKLTSQTVKEDVIHFIRVHEMPLVTEYNGMVRILCPRSFSSKQLELSC